MTLRRVFLIDGLVMIFVGFIFWGWHAPLATEFGVLDAHNFNIYKGTSFGGLFGGALMGFGFAALAVSHSNDTRFNRVAAVCFLAGHCFLGFMVWAKQMALWGTTAGFVLLDLLAWPIAAFLYYVLASLPETINAPGAIPSREQYIRDVAGQEERNRLAQDLHDSVKQQIFSVQTNLATAQARWENDAAGARSAVDRARDSTREAMTEMSALLDRLRRDPIESIGLVEALRRQCEALGFQTGATVETTFGELPGSDCLRPGSMNAVFRIAQEALANVARHARPKHVQLMLESDSETRTFVLDIRDDGQGFETESPSIGMGLRNMQLRAEEIGADLFIESKPGEGANVRLCLPLIDPRAARVTHHQVRLVAVLISVVPTAALTVYWQDSWPYFLPLICIGGAFVAYHSCALTRLRSR